MSTLSRFRPHAPTADRFADTWYWYVNDPDLGYLKLVVVTYLNAQTRGDRQHAHVHVAVAPVDGPHREHDYWFRDVASAAVDGDGTEPWAFRLDVPGAVRMDERSVVLTLPEVSAELSLRGPHLHYWDEPDGAASPFTGPTATLPDRSHWFVFTLGTAAEYRVDDVHGSRAGNGLAYVERGWSTRQAHGFCYLMAVSTEAKLVLTCGMPNDDVSIWAGRLVTAYHDLRFEPLAADQHVTSDLEPARGSASIAIERGDYEVRVSSAAPPGDFYDQVTPALTVFEAATPVAKTMSARLHVEIRHAGEVVETVELPQSILEFGGVLYPAGRAELTTASRPAYRYDEPEPGPPAGS